jgi:phosphatidylserine decarboxylase
LPIAVQAIPFLVAVAILAALSALFGGPWAAAPWAVPFGFILFFFRDPARRAPGDASHIVAPADGRVIEVDNDSHGSRIAVFLSVFNCHINRSPVSGTVTSVRHTPGRFLPAWDRRVASENERNELVIRTPEGEYRVTQIAGVLARRIVCGKKAGDAVARGERIGLIQFGSRTDLVLPPGVEPLVRQGDRVRGGVTVMARAAAAGRRAAS